MRRQPGRHEHKISAACREKQHFFSVLLYFTTWCSILSVQAGCLWLSNIDEEQSEEWCNGVLERESSKLTNGAFLWVSAGASRMITSAPLSFQHCAVVSVFFVFFYDTALTSHLNSYFTFCPLFSILLSLLLPLFSQTQALGLSC